MTSTATQRFRLGVNYWPARTAMGWWPLFDLAEVEADFARIAAAGLDSVRLFLTWEHFQPRPDSVSTVMLRRLIATLDAASRAGLSVMPTLFTGHMSGVNWIPGWALGGIEGDRRFRIVSGDRVVRDGLRSWYADPFIAEAQALHAGEVSGALAGHPALWAWDLGNENSNCVMPPTRTHAREWLMRMNEAIRHADGTARITIGLHMEDLVEDRRLGPADAAEVCDFLTMHGYPGYAAWARGPTDEQLLPFLAHVTRWLAGGAEVVFSEFGAPTYRAGHDDADRLRAACVSPLVEEQAAADYIERALPELHASGCTGAMLWCYADYVRAAWPNPPLDLAVHERFFGQWRADGSPKPVRDVIAAFAARGWSPVASSDDCAWIDIARDDFYRDDAVLPRLYQRYCRARRISAA